MSRTSSPNKILSEEPVTFDSILAEVYHQIGRLKIQHDVDAMVVHDERRFVHDDLHGYQKHKVDARRAPSMTVGGESRSRHSQHRQSMQQKRLSQAHSAPHQRNSYSGNSALGIDAMTMDSNPRNSCRVSLENGGGPGLGRQSSNGQESDLRMAIEEADTIVPADMPTWCTDDRGINLEVEDGLSRAVKPPEKRNDSHEVHWDGISETSNENAPSEQSYHIVFDLGDDDVRRMKKIPGSSDSLTYGSRGSDEALTHVVTETALNFRPSENRQFKIKKPWCDHPELNDIMLCSFSRGHIQAKIDTLMVQRWASERAHGSAMQRELSLVRAETYCSSKLMLEPESRTRSFWQFLCLVFLVYDLAMVPVDLAFELDRGTFYLNLMLLISSFFWTIDIMMTFFTGFYSPEISLLEMRFFQVARHYARTWLVFDLFFVLQDWIDFVISQPGMRAVSLVRSVRVLRFMRILRLLRVFRIAKFRPFLKKLVFEMGMTTQKFDVYRGWLSLTIVFLVAVHLITCVWHGVGSIFDDGWVKLNGCEKSSVIRRYIISMQWTCSRLHGFSVSYEIDNSLDYIMDGILNFFALMATAVYVGQVTVVSMARLTSKQFNMKRLASDYTQRHKISAALNQKVMKTIQAGHIGGAGEVQESESRLIHELPTVLQEDLLFEARVPLLTMKRFFLDVLVVNPRVIRHVSNRAMSTVVVVGDELVFDAGEACDRMLFVMLGSLFYRYHRDWPQGKGNNRVSWDRHSATESQMEESLDKLSKGAAISEPVLWTTWEHTGQLVAEDEAMLLTLDANDFGIVIIQHHEAHVHGVKYAKHFIWNLKRLRHTTEIERQRSNESRNSNNYRSSRMSISMGTPRVGPCDLIDFPDLDFHQLDEDLFDGTEADHFIFISHYKLESGTEATLIRDLLEPILKHDADHGANDLQTPVFIDSEDLSDLAELKTHVENSFCLVLLLTPGVLSRPWCLLEIVWACRYKVNVVPVEIQRPGMKYHFPDEDFYARLLSGKFLNQEAMAVLKGEEIGVLDVEAAIRQVFQKIALPFSPHKSKKVRNAELEDILKRCNDKSGDLPGVGALGAASTRVSRVVRSGTNVSNVDLGRGLTSETLSGTRLNNRGSGMSEPSVIASYSSMRVSQYSGNSQSLAMRSSNTT